MSKGLARTREGGEARAKGGAKRTSKELKDAKCKSKVQLELKIKVTILREHGGGEGSPHVIGVRTI